MARKQPTTRPTHCSRCGEKLAATVAVIGPKNNLMWAVRCSECDAGHCPVCGRHIPNGFDKFCTECGTSLLLKAER